MHRLLALVAIVLFVGTAAAQETRRYENRLVPSRMPNRSWPIIPTSSSRSRKLTRYEAPLLVDDRRRRLAVRAWRFSYNARGIIEMPNRLKAADTALIMVHPWGIDDGQGWRTPEPAGVCDFCTPAKNALAARHTARNRQSVPQIAARQGGVGHVQPARR